MEEIEKYLLKDENVLWKYTEIKNLLKNPIIEILIGIILAITLSIFLNIIFSMLFQESIILYLTLFLLPITIFIIFGISLILPGMRKYLERYNNLKATTKNLKSYEEISIITDKRLIQKSYNAFEIDYTRNPITNLEDIEIYRDIIFVNLASIHVVSTEDLEPFYQVAFKFSNDDERYIPLLFTIPLDNFPEFIDILKELIPLKRKKRVGNYIVNYYQS